MKKILVMTALLIAMTARAQEAVDTAQFVAVYDYECRTQDDEGKSVTDKMQIVVQIGRTMTKSMPISAYARTGTFSKETMKAEYQEAYLHMPTVWTGWPNGQSTVRESIFPHEFEGHEPIPDIVWTLLEDTVTVGGYLCLQATTTFRGVDWRVYYTEEIPSSVGPWRLRGLPGLIVKAENDAHSFCLVELREEATPIIAPEQKPDVQRMDYAKMLRHRNRLFSNKQYPKNPNYYINLESEISHMEVYVFNNDGQQYPFANGYPLLTKAHVYKPLELTEKE